jgi:hypothetical protein
MFVNLRTLDLLVEIDLIVVIVEVMALEMVVVAHIAGLVMLVIVAKQTC